MSDFLFSNHKCYSIQIHRSIQFECWIILNQETSEMFFKMLSNLTSAGSQKFVYFRSQIDSSFAVARAKTYEESVVVVSRKCRCFFYFHVNPINFIKITCLIETIEYSFDETRNIPFFRHDFCRYKMNFIHLSWK